MPRFEVFRCPDRSVAHDFCLDVQGDRVTTATRWCIPLRRVGSNRPVMQRAQSTLVIDGQDHVSDTPSVLGVSASLLRQPMRRLTAFEQAVVEACIEFMPRGH